MYFLLIINVAMYFWMLLLADYSILILLLNSGTVEQNFIPQFSRATGYAIPTSKVNLRLNTKKYNKSCVWW